MSEPERAGGPGEPRTARLRLRPYQAGDLDLIASLYADSRVTAYTKLGPRTRGEVRTILDGYVAAWAADGIGMYALFLATSGDYVGEFGLFRLQGRGEMALRYALRESFWGQGLTTEAGAAVLDDAFGRGGLDRVVSIVQRRNPASGRVMEKLGFTLERSAWDGDNEILIHTLERARWIAAAGAAV